MRKAKREGRKSGSMRFCPHVREEMNEIGVKSCLDNFSAYPLCMYIRLI